MVTDTEFLIKKLLTADNFIDDDTNLKQIIETLSIYPKYPIILIGGTNGKGSTCAYLTTILTNAGYKVGTFTSPHIFEYNERIKINNMPIDNQSLGNALAKIMNHSNSNLGMFKTFTLASHIIFQEHNIDIAIIEVGLGGKKDPTNLFEPTLSAITGVDYDHCNILGNTLDEIGLEKAGIYRTNKPAIYGSKNPPNTVIEHIKSVNATPYLIDQDFNYKEHEFCWDFMSPLRNLYSLPFPSMRGKEQVINASIAIIILTLIRNEFPVSISQIKNGLLQTSLIGRFQVMPGTPQVIFDTAHNPQAVDVMHRNMLKLHFARRNFAVFGIAQDKNWQSIIKQHAKNFDLWFLSPIKSDRSADPKDIQKLLIELNVNQNNIFINTCVMDSFSKAYQQLKSDDRLVCFGSFLIIEEAYQSFQGIRK
ncbi:MAG: Mur ligase family protein [Burkholderiales bacterium]|nr:Mur ligase family protein [Burkholderiales bacterium]